MAVECRPAGDCAPARREGPFYHVGDATGGRAGARTKEEDEDGGPPRERGGKRRGDESIYNRRESAWDDCFGLSL